MARAQLCRFYGDRFGNRRGGDLARIKQNSTISISQMLVTSAHRMH